MFLKFISRRIWSDGIRITWSAPSSVTGGVTDSIATVMLIGRRCSRQGRIRLIGIFYETYLSSFTNNRIDHYPFSVYNIVQFHKLISYCKFQAINNSLPPCPLLSVFIFYLQITIFSVHSACGDDVSSFTSHLNVFHTFLKKKSVMVLM